MNGNSRRFRRIYAAFLLTLLAGCAWAFGQAPREGFREKVDEIVSEAYRAAARKFPCKVKTRGKPAILRWQQVDRCLNDANDRVDWEDLSQRIQELRKNSGYSAADALSVIESSLTAHALPYERVFAVKNSKALLPLTNSLLKFLPEGSLLNLPVFDKSGSRLGEFAGAFAFEKSGGLNAANTFRMYLFQYTDAKGQMQTPAILGRLLLDSYGVPWKDAVSQPGFRLGTDRLVLKR
jgi:hypothetical protein